MPDHADHNRYSIDARAPAEWCGALHAERIVVLLATRWSPNIRANFRRDQIIYDPCIICRF